MKDLTLAIQNKVYTHSYAPERASEHYQAVGLKTVNKADLNNKDAPVELRAMRSQVNVEEFILQGKLFEARIRYLNSLEGQPIIYSQTSRAVFHERELRSRFYIYVVEAGLNFSEFESLQSYPVRAQELDPFVHGKDISRALESAERYWDLLLTSEWTRNRLVELLSSPDSVKSLHRDVILRRLESEATAEYNSQQTRKTWKNLYGLVKDKEPAIGPEEHLLRQGIWKDLFQKTQTRSCRKVLLQSL
ncbi:hypothetical protein D3C72_1427040 [compost metagenome]